MRRRLVIAAGILTALAVVAWLVPASRARLTAAGTVAEAFEVPWWRPFAPTVAVRDERVADIPVDVYDVGGDAPAVVLVPGAVPAGRDDPRVQRLARVLARAERRLVVPELEVYGERLVEADVQRLVDLGLALSSSHGREDVVFVGISFGGSLALVAAADPRLDGRVGGVATFGAYADLVGLVQAATTGVSVVGDRTVPWDADPRAEEVVRAELTALLPPEAARAVRAALAADDPARLPPGDARVVYELLTTDDPGRTYRLFGDLPAEIRERVAVVSPVSVADRLSEVPVVAMHSRDDPVVPFGELLRLGAAVPEAGLFAVEGLEHAGLEVTAPGGWISALDDLETVWSFAGRALRWQEPAWPWGPG